MNRQFASRWRSICLSAILLLTASCSSLVSLNSPYEQEIDAVVQKETGMIDKSGFGEAVKTDLRAAVGLAVSVHSWKLWAMQGRSEDQQKAVGVIDESADLVGIQLESDLLTAMREDPEYFTTAIRLQNAVYDGLQSSNPTAAYMFAFTFARLEILRDLSGLEGAISRNDQKSIELSNTLLQMDAYPLQVLAMDIPLPEGKLGGLEALSSTVFSGSPIQDIGTVVELSAVLEEWFDQTMEYILSGNIAG
jgi:hypothetical protein